MLVILKQSIQELLQYKKYLLEESDVDYIKRIGLDDEMLSTCADIQGMAKMGSFAFLPTAVIDMLLDKYPKAIHTHRARHHAQTQDALRTLKAVFGVCVFSGGGEDLFRQNNKRPGY